MHLKYVNTYIIHFTLINTFNFISIILYQLISYFNIALVVTCIKKTYLLHI